MSKFIGTLLWKSWCIRKRHYIITFIELFFPILFYVLLLYTKSISHTGDGPSPITVPNATYSPRSKDDIMTIPLSNNRDRFEIAYAPSNDVNNNTMNKVRDTLVLYNFYVDLIPATNETEIERLFYKKYGNFSSYDSLIYGVIFHDNSSYTLRPVSKTFDTNSLFSGFALPDPGTSYFSYLAEGFLTLQIAINDVLYGLNAKPQSTVVNFNLTEFPYPSYLNEKSFQKLFISLIPMLTFGYYVLVPNLITHVIQEKNSGSREWMSMVGIPKISILFGWVLHSSVLYFFSTLVCSVILQVPIDGSPILSSTNFFVVWVLLLLFCTSTVLYVLAFTSFISNSNVAVIFGSMLWILPSVTINSYQNAKNMTFALKLLTCIFPPVCFNWAFLAISSYEVNHEKVTLFNIFSMYSEKYQDISLGIAMVFLIVTIFIYALLFLYLDSIRPGKFGRAKPWYFPFHMLSRLFNTRKPESRSPESKKKANFEDVKHLPVGLSFQGIKKKFGNVIAIEDVTFDVYKGQITALLGHNGAGKTTLINIITGMFSPNEGKLWKDGKNVFDSFGTFQTNLGLCPQHDLLFTYLNVYEHVMFFGMLRGLSVKKAAKESMELLKYFGISEKANSLVKKLSGGMKRKLSLSISLIGNPEILILDEPTSGMDPESRRETWNKLLALRGERTIILTTHYMEEAEVLGDMIAIMDHGVLKCYGTSLYLKKKYGSGYKVSIPACGDYESINQVVKSFIPDYSLPANGASNEGYSFPLEKSAILGNLFQEMEKYLPDGGSKMHVVCTTMDDVFLKVAREEVDEKDSACEDEEVLINDSIKSDDAHSSNEALTPKSLTGISLFKTRLSALFKKKMLYFYHSWSSSLFLTIIYPFFILLLPLLLSSIILKGEFSDPPLAMELDIYGDTNVLISSSSLKYSSLKNSFIKVVKDQGSASVLLDNNTSVNDALLDAGTENLSKYRFSYIVATNLSQDVPNLYYSSLGTHSPSIAVSLFYKAFYYSQPSQVITYNHPLNFQNGICNEGTMIIFASVPPSVWLFSFPTAIAIITFFFSKLHHEERISSGKLLQLMTGTTPIMYWISAFLCDLAFFMIISLLIMLYNYIMDSAHLFTSTSDYGIFWMVLLISFLNSVWFGYFMSNFLKTFTSLFSINIMLTLLFGQVAYFVLMFIKELKPDSTIVLFVHYLLMLYPSYCTSSLIYKVIYHYSLRSITKMCFHYIDISELGQDLFVWGDSGINKELMFLAFEWMIYAALVFLFDYGIFSWISNYIFNRYGGKIDVNHSISDEDVSVEKEKVEGAIINGIRATQNNVVVYNLAKKYSRKFTAVKDINFLVRKGECFGLLGVNGAGKSTTFQMLSGDLPPTKGLAVIFGDNLKECKSKYQSHIGFCPQNDAIIPELTGYEMLHLYANLRGINPSILNQTVSHWITQFGLQSVSNRRCETYSGGNKRKLSTAIALIGDPQVVLLDEPTTGVDPVARRKFWAILSKLQKKGSTIILTSHSMDECEAVCDRLTIMVQGEMKCIGNIQRLKEIYGQGFTVLVQLEEHADSQLASLKSEIIRHFSPHAVLRDEHIGLLHYHINNPDYKWSKLFSVMENIKQDSTIVKGYIISETTLEQIFLHFAKQ